MTIQYLSQKKYDELEAELAELKNTKMLETAKQIDEAKQNGDLSENAEYHMAREQLSWEQGRVKEITNILDNAEVLKNTGTSDGSVGIGSTISVEIKGKQKEYTIVGAQEANPLEGKISNESPIGQAVLGKVSGDVVEVEVPVGKQVYTIIAIT